MTITTKAYEFYEGQKRVIFLTDDEARKQTILPHCAGSYPSVIYMSKKTYMELIQKR